MENIYDRSFYENRHNTTLYAAQKVLKILNKNIANASILDLGCGTGTWASVGKKIGASKILGIDGDWVDKKLLQIEDNEFITCDLNNVIPQLDQKYDLAIWLENIEHLEPGRGERVLDWITSTTHAVLFSGAIPLQGGTGHINEQWQSYWARLFKEQKFRAFDILRPTIWDDELIPYWYKQNMILYVKDDQISKWIDSDVSINSMPNLNIIHPDKWLIEKQQELGVKKTFSMFLRSLRRKLILSQNTKDYQK